VKVQKRKASAYILRDDRTIDGKPIPHAIQIKKRDDDFRDRSRKDSMVFQEILNKKPVQ
jgi:hypothetical protein